MSTEDRESFCNNLGKVMDKAALRIRKHRLRKRRLEVSFLPRRLPITHRLASNWRARNAVAPRANVQVARLPST